MNNITKFISYNKELKKFEIRIEKLSKLKKNEYYFKLKSFSLNRADLLQKRGLYNPPLNRTQIMGLEGLGYLYDKNMNLVSSNLYGGLLIGGGYSQITTINKNHLINFENNIVFDKIGAAIPESFIVSFQLIQNIKFRKNKVYNILINAAGNTVGLSLIQILKNYYKDYNINIFYTSTNLAKLEKINKLFNLDINNGIVLNLETRDILLNNLDSKFDIIFDCLGSKYIDFNISLLNIDGILINYGTLTGYKIDSNYLFNKLIKKNIKIIGSNLRLRTDSYKSNLVKKFNSKILPLILNETLYPVVYKSYDISYKDESDMLNKIDEGHNILENNINVGKIIYNYIE